jgi:hypothetical protein
MKIAIAAILATLAIALVVGLPLASMLNEGRSQVGGPPPAASPTGAAASPASTAAASPASGTAVHENLILGYRLTLPDSYRRSRSLLVGPNEETLGHDAYVPRSAADERSMCLREQQGSLLSPERAADVRIVVHRDTGMSAVDWASTPVRRMPFSSVVPTTIEGREAAKVVHQPSGDSAFYVIRANGRIYELTPELDPQPSTQPKGWLDNIAMSFQAIAPQPFPSSVPSAPPVCGS